MKKNVIKLLISILFIAIAPLALVAQDYSWTQGKPSLSFVDKAGNILVKDTKGSHFLHKLYKSMYETPIWVTDKGLTNFGKKIMGIISKDKSVPRAVTKEYTIKVKQEIKNLKADKGGTIQDKLILELDISRLYKKYTDYLIYGGIDWTTFKSKLAALKKAKGADFGWIVYTSAKTPISILKNAINTGSLKNALKAAEPTRFNYAKLKNYLLKYIRINESGKWKKLPRFSTKIRSGHSSNAIPAIKNNLTLTGDLKGCQEDKSSTVYDKCLLKAVKHFQIRYGLTVDGVIGRGTYERINTPLTRKIRLMRLNMDRIKRLRHKSEKVRIELNVPSFRLNVIDHNSLVDTIRVITGRPNHPTPIFGSKIQYIVVNPWWKIPESIVRAEMLKHLIVDPYYYERRGKILTKTWDENSPRIDPGTIDWAKYRDKHTYMPFHFMQVPGAHNALGKIKFIFPNRFSVYIHDTPVKSIFFNTRRARSHGCMRIQKPRELLKVFASYNDNINVEDIMQRLQGTKKKILGLSHKIPVDITYLTAYVDPYGYLNFRNDIYNYDKYTLKDYKYKVDRYHKESSQKRKKKKATATAKKTDNSGYQISEVYPQ